MRCHICDYEPFARSDFHRGLSTRHVQFSTVVIDSVTKRPICQECQQRSRSWAKDDGEIELLDIEVEEDGLDRYS